MISKAPDARYLADADATITWAGKNKGDVNSLILGIGVAENTVWANRSYVVMMTPVIDLGENGNRSDNRLRCLVSSTSLGGER